MEYVYAAMLLTKAGKKVEEPAMKQVLEAAGITVDEAQIKAVVAALENVDVDAAIAEASQFTAQAPATAAPAQDDAPQPKEEDSKKKAEEEKKSDEDAAAGLGALFG